MLRTLLPLLVACFLSVPARAASYPSGLMQWVHGSDLIFEGTVERVGATTVPRVSDMEARMAIVRTEHTLYGEGMLGSYRGELTVAFDGQPPVKAGDRLVFFCQGWILAQTPVVTAVAWLDPARYPDLAAAVTRIRRYYADNPLFLRVEASAAVIIGTVNGTRVISESHNSMHQPLWAEASVSVVKWIKGRTQKQIRVRFDESPDIAHIREPKLVKGERVLLLLQKDRTPERYLIIDPLDRESVDQEGAIERLLALPPASPVLE